MTSPTTLHTILITGINGFIATEVALTFLEAGYAVRGTVRSIEKAELWKASYAQYIDRLQFVEVADITIPGALDDAVKGVDIVLHIASPMSYGNPENVESEYLKPAISGTLETLRSASKELRVKKVIITSSVAAIIDISNLDTPRTEEDWNPITYEQAVDAKSIFVSYLASKKLAEEAAWTYVKEEKPTWALVTLLPSFVFGPSRQPGTPIAGTNSFPAAILLGQDVDFATISGGPAFVDVRDLSRAHFLAATSPLADNQRFIISGPEIFPSEYPAIFAKAVPSIASTLPCVPEGFVNAPSFKLDTRKSQDVLKVTYRDAEESLRDLARYILEAKEKDSAKVEPA